MLFFPYPTIKRLSPVKRKIKFHDRNPKTEFSRGEHPKAHVIKAEKHNYRGIWRQKGRLPKVRKKAGFSL